MGGVKRYGVLLAGVLVAALCVRLGFWQVGRLEQRRQANAVVAANLERAPLPPERWILDSSDYRRGVATGEFDFERQIVVVARSRRGTPGVHVVTPLRLDDGSAVLVERGFTPSPDGKSIDLTGLVEPGSSRVEGVLLPRATGEHTVPTVPTWPLYLRSIDPLALEPLYPYALRPYVLRRTKRMGARAGPLWVLDVPQPTDGPHLSYAVQWFAFATIALVGSVILARKPAAAGHRMPLRPPPPTGG